MKWSSIILLAFILIGCKSDKIEPTIQIECDGNLATVHYFNDGDWCNNWAFSSSSGYWREAVNPNDFGIDLEEGMLVRMKFVVIDSLGSLCLGNNLIVITCMEELTQ